jgi:hypothetical protein
LVLARVEKRRRSSALRPHAAAPAPVISAQIEGSRPDGSVPGSGEVIAVEMKQVVGPAAGGEEPPRLSG